MIREHESAIADFRRELADKPLPGWLAFLLLPIGAALFIAASLGLAAIVLLLGLGKALTEFLAKKSRR